MVGSGRGGDRWAVTRGGAGERRARTASTTPNAPVASPTPAIVAMRASGSSGDRSRVIARERGEDDAIADHGKAHAADGEREAPIVLGDVDVDVALPRRHVDGRRLAIALHDDAVLGHRRGDDASLAGSPADDPPARFPDESLLEHCGAFRGHDDALAARWIGARSRSKGEDEAGGEEMGAVRTFEGCAPRSDIQLTRPETNADRVPRAVRATPE